MTISLKTAHTEKGMFAFNEMFVVELTGTKSLPALKKLCLSETGATKVNFGVHVKVASQITESELDNLQIQGSDAVLEALAILPKSEPVKPVESEPVKPVESEPVKVESEPVKPVESIPQDMKNAKANILQLELKIKKEKRKVQDDTQEGTTQIQVQIQTYEANLKAFVKEQNAKVADARQAYEDAKEQQVINNLMGTNTQESIDAFKVVEKAYKDVSINSKSEISKKQASLGSEIKTLNDKLQALITEKSKHLNSLETELAEAKTAYDTKFAVIKAGILEQVEVYKTKLANQAKKVNEAKAIYDDAKEAMKYLNGKMQTFKDSVGVFVYSNNTSLKPKGTVTKRKRTVNNTGSSPDEILALERLQELREEFTGKSGVINSGRKKGTPVTIKGFYYSKREKVFYAYLEPSEHLAARTPQIKFESIDIN